MLQGEEVTLEEMLACRDRRAIKQTEYLNQYHNTLISFCMNIPGPVKTNKQIKKGFDSGVQDIYKYLQNNNMSILDSTKYDEKTGNELILVVDCPKSGQIKKAMTEIEENHPLGRLFDIDVIDLTGHKMSRDAFRKCFICNCQAQECASSRKHSVPEMQEYISKRLAKFESAD